jgi:hypothetical protein
LEKEVEELVSVTANKGAKVASAIDPFDPIKLAEIKRSL